MSEIVSAKAEGGLIKAVGSDGRQYEIWIDDRGVPHTGRTNTWLIPDGENASTGHVVEILLPVGGQYPLSVPWRVTVRHANDA